ncbi:phenylacetate--CoA ligase family protein [Anaerosinus sp.]|uniref:phenylacetate--CoA ligase family protein n=1 Tax=Selenobaculum sp. TaxID=3074374 RepID=UPI003AB1C392
MNRIEFSKSLLGKIINKYKNFEYYRNNAGKFFAMQYLSKKQIEEYQVEQLKKILQSAVDTVPYYRYLKSEINFSNFSKKELHKFPIVTKEIMRENIDMFLSDRFVSKGKWSNTSGSTGNVFEFMIGENSDVIEAIFKYRGWGMGRTYNYKKKDPVLMLRSYAPNSNGDLTKVDKVNNYWYMSAFDINQKNLSVYLKFIKKSESKILRGYPSSIYIFTLLLEKNNIKLKQIETIVTSSETLLPLWRDKIEKYWGIPVLDRYGQNERSVVLHQCWAGNYHNDDEYGIVEIGNNNEIIATSLFNFSMPFIRYNTGDLAIPLDQSVDKCPCGRNLYIPLKGIRGRADDILVKGDGTRVPTINIYTIMHEISKLEQFKIVQKVNMDLEIFAVCVDRDRLVENQIIEALRQRVGNLKMKVIFTDNIERDKKTGKVKVIESFVDKERIL